MAETQNIEKQDPPNWIETQSNSNRNSKHPTP